MITHLSHPPLLVEALRSFILDPWLLFRIGTMDGGPSPPSPNGRKCCYYLGTTLPGDLCGRRTHFEQPPTFSKWRDHRMLRVRNYGSGNIRGISRIGGFRNEYERRIRENGGLGVIKLKNPSPPRGSE
ncbi:hypothetical protein CDAR_582401 [Caerostris darwini]|uniref:Uncharacterized protein n=1 Tax=Caerostris darwini TaxID=1538125 RepID=A0AAV4RL02_9ARAC|nr:hypothetical protein CDAR_582401 [Caerostris darwini]